MSSRRSRSLWNFQSNDVQAVVEIVAEPAFIDQLLQVHIRCGDDTDVHLDGVDASQAHELTLLDHAQQLGLSLRTYGSDFIKKYRPLVGDFEQTLLGCNGAGECPANVAEQRALQEIDRHAPAVDRNERLVGSRTLQVNGLRDQLFSRSALSLNQDGAPTGGNLGHKVEQTQHPVALADDVAVAETLFERSPQLQVLAV